MRAWLINKIIGSQLWLRRIGLSRWGAMKVAMKLTCVVEKTVGRGTYHKKGDKHGKVGDSSR